VLEGQIKGEIKREREMHRESDKGGEDRPIARDIGTGRPRDRETDIQTYVQ
jgi:hypothetical protein